MNPEFCKWKVDERLFVCLSCSNVLMGQPCFRRHIKSCVMLKQAVRRFYTRKEPCRIAGHAISRSPMWIDCKFDDEDCVRQKRIHALDKKRSSVIVLIRWLKLLKGIHSKNRLEAPLLALGKCTVFSHHLIRLVVDWLFFSFE